MYDYNVGSFPENVPLTHERTNINNFYIPAAVTNNATPLAFITRGQPGIGTTVGEGLYVTRGVGGFDRGGVIETGGGTAFQPSIATSTVIEYGQRIASNQCGAVGAQQSRIFIDQPTDGLSLWCTSSTNHVRVGDCVHQNTDEEVTERWVLIAWKGWCTGRRYHWAFTWYW